MGTSDWSMQVKEIFKTERKEEDYGLMRRILMVEQV